MDITEIQNKLKSAVPGGVLEKSRFGRTQQGSLWVEGQKLPAIAAFLKSDEELQLDWLENLSAIQMDKALVTTYFLRSSKTAETLILRASVEPGTPSKETELPSVAETWAMAVPFEREIQEFFGIRFVADKREPAYPGPFMLPKGWNGYPLRKTYVFPTEFFGISHSRRPNAVESPQGGNA